MCVCVCVGGGGGGGGLNRAAILCLRGYSVQPYANESLTYWLPGTTKSLNWLCIAFSWLGMSSTAENAQKVY